MGYIMDWITAVAISRQLAEQNAKERGVITYKTSQIGGFVKDDAHNSNVVCSGGIQSLRSDVITNLCIRAANANKPVILLHKGDADLCAKMQAVFRNHHGYIEAGPNAKHYDPLYQLRNAMISKIIVDTSPKQYKMTSDGGAFIDAMTGYLSGKKRMVRLSALKNCPYDNLHAVLKNAEADHILPSKLVSDLQTKHAQGQAERKLVKSYFEELYQECMLLLPANESEYRDCISIFEAVRQKAVLNLDIIYSGNTLLLEIIAAQLKMLITQRIPFYLILDDLTFQKDSGLKKIVTENATGVNYAVVGEDVFTLCEDDRNIINSIISHSSKCYVFHHANDVSAEYWADVLGTYKKKEITLNYGTGDGSGFGSGLSWHKNKNKHQGITIITKDEAVVSAKEITDLHEKGGYVYTVKPREIAHVNEFLPQ